MISIKGISIIIIMMFVQTLAFSQTILQPNFALKSHETLDISRIEVLSEKTLFYMTIENRIEGGNFCADRNIWLILSDGERLKLSESSGIPVCPEIYKFRNIGEKLNFILTFPPVKSGMVSLDLIEECSENCFSFYGVILEEGLNTKINEAFALAESGKITTALDRFISLAGETGTGKGAEGIVYYNIIKIASETGNTVKGAEWYKKLSSSHVTAKEKYLEDLNIRGIRY